MSKLCLFLLLCVFSFNCSFSQTKIGEFKGKDLDCFLGKSVAVSSDGKTIVIPAGKVDCSNSDSAPILGYVNIYSRVEGQWKKKGQTIYSGAGINSRLSQVVSLSASGDVVAIGNSQNCGRSPFVRVYAWNGMKWKLLGNEIKPESKCLGSFGNHLSLSSNGKVLALGIPKRDYAIVYEYNGKDWVQRGEKLIGDKNKSYFGQGIALSADGSILAIGIPHIRMEKRLASVKTYKWNGEKWEQLGQELFSESIGDDFGYSLSITPNGKNLVVSSLGYTKVYSWDGKKWQQRGDKILLRALAISISEDGSMIAFAKNCSKDKEFVVVYKWNTDKWSTYFSRSSSKSIYNQDWSVALQNNTLIVGRCLTGFECRAGEVIVYDLKKR